MGVSLSTCAHMVMFISVPGCMHGCEYMTTYRWVCMFVYVCAVAICVHLCVHMWERTCVSVSLCV